MINYKLIYCTILSILLVAGCREKETRFQQMPSSHTGIRFNNLISESDTLNILQFEYLYNGAGVGAGDFNNDGLTDIFFAGNMVSSRLYLNRGDFRFEDITTAAGVETNLWCTGVALSDVNQDGLLDIYASTIHPHENGKSPNLLFLNKGMNPDGLPAFEEVAAKTGLADSAYSTQAAFLDYDLDGDLDVYLLNNSLENYTRNTPIGQRTDGYGKSQDKLYRCEGISADGLPSYKDASAEAGILTEGWGLGVMVNDINQDGYPDVYAANDFLSNDHLYINNRNGTFTNSIASCLKHQEYNGMGMDAADINNDGFNDIMVTDMMPEDNLRQKTMFGNIGYDKFMLNLRKGYQPQYVRNVLQLNNGNGTFSDIGYLAGIYATDWSWSGLFADFDNDGYRDLLITNGYPKDVTDLDFVVYSRESSLFGTDKARLKKAITAVNALEGVKKPNFIFKNNGDLTFTNQAPAWGLDQPSYSNGAAYADLDNDGDLDLVMNNINGEAFVYQNNTRNKAGTDHNFLQLKLAGNKGNLQGLGSRITLYANGKLFFAEHQLQRGYKSTVESREHFGLGNIDKIDSLKIEWQNGKVQVLKNLPVNREVILEEKNATDLAPPKAPDRATLFKESHQQRKVSYRPRGDEDFVDFKQGQALLPQKYTQLGPGIAVGDVNGDGYDDFIVGAPKRRAAAIFYQQRDGTFKTDSLPAKTQEDLGLLLFDADGDADLDLYCASGSAEFGRDLQNYQHRFYRNDGKGKFTPDPASIPAVRSSGSCAVASDFDKDGDLDLFIGGRVVPLRYPESPESYLLQNDGTGKFTDVTPDNLKKTGMVTSALWTDFDNDHWPDLVIAGEWMPITFFKNREGKLTRFLPGSPAAESTVGWWNSLAAGDFDNDGDTDYIAGNVGLNSLYKASDEEPVCLYAKDFDENGSLDPVLCRYIQGREYITHPRETLTEQMVGLRRVLTRYSLYGKSTFAEIFPSEKLKGALVLKGTRFVSSYIENKGNGSFEFKTLPVEAQLSPVFGIATTDINADGNLDVLLVGNSYSTEPLTGYYDAGIGAYLQGDGKGNFTAVHVNKSGFFVDGDAKGLAMIKLQNRVGWITTINRDSLKIFERTAAQIKSTVVKLLPNDAYAEITFADGKKQKQEFYYGQSYLSQSSRVLEVPKGIVKVTIVDGKGVRRKVEL